jgi:hypothetical protein
VGKLEVPENVETETLLAIKEVTKFKKTHFRELLNPKTFDPFSAQHSKYSITVPTEAHSKLSYYYEPLTPKELPGNWRFPRLTASSGSNLTDFHLPHRDKLDLELMGHRLPYSGLEDLFDTFGIPHRVMQQGYSSPQSTWTISRPATILLESSIEDETARIQIKHPTKLNREGLSVGLRILTGRTPILRRSIDLPTMSKSSKQKWSITTIEEHIDDAVAADVHLSHDGEILGHYWISDPRKSLNPRLVLHKLSDKKGVIGPSFFDQRANSFEDSVSLLLNLLGLTAITYGGISSLKDAPDILAYSTLGHLFVIECTTTDVGRSGKLLKLSQRTREIRDAANQGGIGYPHILPVMFTTLMKEETKACWDEAADFGIALVCHENIQNLIGRVEAPPTPQELYDAALATIPVKSDEQGSLFKDNQ